MKSWIEEYLKEQNRITQALPVDEIESWINLLGAARAKGANIFACGNGGSAANCSHFAVDLGKGASVMGEKSTPPGRFKVLSLNDNVPWLTALGNDYSYDDVFVEQLKNYGRAGDVLIAVSVSGNSPNVVKAVEWANANGITTLGMVGNKSGSKLSRLATRLITMEGQHYGRVEDAQMHVLHMLCYAFIEGAAK